MNLYQIEQEILDCVDLETGEIIDIDRIEKLTMARDQKVENICLWIKNLNAEIEALKAEKKAFEQRQKTAENKAESLKRYMTKYLGGASFNTAKVAVSFRRSEQVKIADSVKLPDKYLRFKEPEVNKTALKAALKAGAQIEGCSIVENQNIQIK